MKSNFCTLSLRMCSGFHRPSNRCDQSSSELFPCPFCGMELSGLKEGKRQSHYEAHLFNQGSPSSSRPMQDSPSDKNVSWRPSFNSTPPHNATTKLIPLLKKALIVSHQSGVTRKAALCHDKSVRAGVEMWDLTWGSSRSGLPVNVDQLHERSICH